MSYQVSARKYRPQSFEEVVGQPHIVRTLTNTIAASRVAHAYLFSGIRGVGKTTVARIFAKALNCVEGPTPTPCNRCEHCLAVTAGNAPDVLEIDGASNNSVDNIRDLTDNIRYRPLACRNKIYIIDEVHMLSQSAFNALLKTLEEPPEHAVFLFATTETHKIPQTILSRCQHHAFRRVSREEIAAHLAALAEKDGIEVSRSALSLLARAADGSLRDALSLFDQAASFGGGRIAEDDVSLMLGAVGQVTLAGFAADILNRDAAAALNRLRGLIGAGQDLQILAADLVEHFRNLLVCTVSDAPWELIDLSRDDVNDLMVQADQAPREVVEQVLALLLDAQERCRRALAPQFVLEAALVRTSQAPQLADLGELLARLDALSAGADTPAPRKTAPAAPPPAPRAPAPPARLERSSPPPVPSTASASEPPAAAPLPRDTPARETAPPRERMADPPAGAVAPPKPPEMAPVLPQGGTPAGKGPDWPAIVLEIRRRRPALASYLEQGALKSASPSRLVVGFPPAYEVMHSMVNRPDNREFISRVASEASGQPLEVTFEMFGEAGPEVATLAQEFEAQKAETHRKEVERAMEMPFIRDVLEEFGGEIVELHKPEPGTSPPVS